MAEGRDVASFRLRATPVPERTSIVGPVMTGPSVHRRRSSVISAGAWSVIALVIVRMASGGGTLTGFDYVVREAPWLAILTGTVLVAVAIALVVGFLVEAGWAHRVSVVAGAIALPFGLVLGFRGHDSAWVLTAAALIAIWFGLAPTRVTAYGV